MKPTPRSKGPVKPGPNATKRPVGVKRTDHGKHPGVRYISEDLIRRVTKQHNLEMITNLALTFNQEGEKKIKYIEQLEALRRLESLNLSCNAIEKMEKLERLTKLRDLNLSFNHLTKIEGLEALVNLQVLNLTGNNIHHIPVWLGKRLKALRILRIAKNQLASLSEVTKLKPLRDLIQLSVSENPLTELPHARLYIIFHLRSLEVVDGQCVEVTERDEARDRFEQEEVEHLEQQLEQMESRYAQLEDQHNKSMAEIKLAEDKNKNFKKFEKKSEAKVQELEQQLETKNDLLKRKTSELTKACEKHYELEQELAFFKIDHKFAALGHFPDAGDNMDGIDEDGLIGESPYIGKARYRNNKFAFETSTPSQGQPIRMQSLRPESRGEMSSIDEESRGKLHQALDSQLTDKQKEIDRAQDKLQKLQEELDKREQQMLQVTEELNRVAMATPRQQLPEPEKQNIQRQLTRRISTVNELRDEAAKIEDEMRRTEGELQVTEQTVQTLRGQLKRMNSRDQLYGKVKAEMADKEQQLSARGQLYDDLQRELDEMMRRIAMETEGIKDLEQQLTEGQAAINDEMKQELEGVVHGLQDYLARVQRKADQKKDDFDALLHERDALKDRVGQLENEMTILDSEAGDLYSLRKKMQELQDSLNEQRQLNNTLHDQINPEMDSQLHMAQAEVDRLQDELLNARRHAQAEKFEQEEQNHQEQEGAKRLTEQLNAMKLANNQLRKQLDKKNQEKAEETVAPEELQRRFQQLLDNLDTGEGPVDQYDEDDHVGALVADLEGHLVDKLRKQQEEAKRAHDKQKKAQADVENMKDRLRKAESQLKRSQATQDRQKDAELERMRQEMERMKTALNDGGKDHGRSHPGRDNRMKADHDLLPNQFLQATPRADGSSVGLQESLKSMNSEDQAMYDQLQAELAKIHQQMKKADDAANRKLQDAQDYISRLENALKEQESQLNHRQKDQAKQHSSTQPPWHGPQHGQGDDPYTGYPSDQRHISRDVRGPPRGHPNQQDRDVWDNGVDGGNGDMWSQQADLGAASRHPPDRRVEKMAADLQRAEDEIDHLQQVLEEKQQRLEDTMRQTDRSSHAIATQQGEIDDLHDLLDQQRAEILRLNHLLDKVSGHPPGTDYENELGRLNQEVSGLQHDMASQRPAFDEVSGRPSQRNVPWYNPERTEYSHDNQQPGYAQGQGNSDAHQVWPQGPGSSQQQRPGTEVQGLQYDNGPSYPVHGRFPASVYGGQQVPSGGFQTLPSGAGNQMVQPGGYTVPPGGGVQTMPPGGGFQPVPSGGGVQTVSSGGVFQPVPSGGVMPQTPGGVAYAAAVPGGQALTQGPVLYAVSGAAGLGSQGIQGAMTLTSTPGVAVSSTPAVASQVAMPTVSIKGILKKPGEEEALVCNVPEHHDLEDYVDKLQKKVKKLKEKLLRNREEKHARSVTMQAEQQNMSARQLAGDLENRQRELEGLDLAIERQKLNLKRMQDVEVELGNSRKQALQELEEVKNSRRSEKEKRDERNRRKREFMDGRRDYDTTDSDYDDDYDPRAQESRRQYLEGEIECLDETLAKRRAKLRAADQLLQECEADLNDAREQARETVRKYDEVQQSYNTTVQDSVELEARVEEASLQLLHAQEEVDSLRGQIKTLDRQRNQMEMTIKEINKIIITKDAEFRNIDAKLKKSTQRLDEVESRYATLQEEESILREDVENAERKMADYNAKLDKYEDQIHNASLDLESHDNKLGQVRADLLLTEQSLKQRKQELSDLMSRAEEKSGSLQSQIKEQETRLAELQDQNDQLKDTFLERKEALQNLRDDIVAEEDMRQQIMSTVNKQRAELKHILEMQSIEKSELESLKDLHTQKLRELEKTQADLREEKSELQSLHSDVDKKTAEMEQLREALTKEKGNIDLLTEERRRVEEGLKMLSHEKDLLDNSCKDAENKLLQQKKQQMEVEDAIQTQQDKLDQVDDVFLQTKQKLEKVNYEYEKMQMEQANLDEEMKNDKVALKKIKLKLSDSEQAYKQVEQKMADRKSEYVTMCGELDRLRDEILQSQKLHEECTMKQTQKQQEMRSLIVEVDERYAETNRSKMTLHKITKEVEKEETRLSRLLSDSQVQLENLKSDVASKQEELQQVSGTLAALEKDMERKQHTENRITELETRIATLENQLSSQGVTVSDLTSSIQMKDEEVQGIKEQYKKETTELGEMCSRLQQELGMKKKELKEYRQRTTSELEELEAIAQEHCRRANRLSDELRSLQQEYMDAKKQLMTQNEIMEKEEKLEQTLYGIKTNIEKEVAQGFQDLDKTRIETLEEVEDLHSQKEKLQCHLEDLKENMMAIRTHSEPSTAVIASTEPQEWKREALREKIIQEQDQLKMQLRNQVTKHVEAIQSARVQSEGTLDSLRRKLYNLEDVLSTSHSQGDISIIRELTKSPAATGHLFSDPMPHQARMGYAISDRTPLSPRNRKRKAYSNARHYSRNESPERDLY